MKKGTCRVIYDKTDDSYRLEVKRTEEKDWGLVMIAKCQPDKNGDPTMIHYTFLTELLQTVSAGFTLFD